jgi:hypothetical protein
MKAATFRFQEIYRHWGCFLNDVLTEFQLSVWGSKEVAGKVLTVKGK